MRRAFEKAATLFAEATPTFHSTHPPVLSLDGFMSAADAHEIVQLAEQLGFDTSHKRGCGPQSQAWPLCQHLPDHLQCLDLPACVASLPMQRLEARLRQMLHVPRENCEGLGLFRYRAPGGTFPLHHDQMEAVPTGVPGGREGPLLSV